MGSEIILLGYGLVCFSMIFFNLIQSRVLMYHDTHLYQESQGLEQLMAEQFVRIEKQQPAEEQHFQKLERRLLQLRNLLAFDRILEQAEITHSNNEFSAYLQGLQPLLVRLAKVYMKRESIQVAYFAHFLTKHHRIMEARNDEIQQLMLLCMQKENLYCRVNGFRALCAFGAQETVLEGIRIIDETDVFFHSKLLTELLFTYTGDPIALIDALWEQRPTFQIETQVALLNYIRFKTGKYCPHFHSILTEESQNKELRLASLRYFGKYIYAPALPPLLNMVTQEDPVHWEYASIAASSLARYEGENVIHALTKAMSSEQWYVRYNAANALKTKHLDYDDLIEVVHTGDRYAREMVMYRLLAREQEENMEGGQRCDI